MNKYNIKKELKYYRKKLKLHKITIEKAQETFEKTLKQKIFKKEKNTNNIIGGCIYIAALICNEKRTQREVADVAGVTEVIIRKCYKKILDEIIWKKRKKKCLSCNKQYYTLFNDNICKKCWNKKRNENIIKQQIIKFLKKHKSLKTKELNQLIFTKITPYNQELLEDCLYELINTKKIYNKAKFYNFNGLNWAKRTKIKWFLK